MEPASNQSYLDGRMPASLALALAQQLSCVSFPKPCSGLGTSCHDEKWNGAVVTKQPKALAGEGFLSELLALANVKTYSDADASISSGEPLWVGQQGRQASNATHEAITISKPKCHR